MVKGVEPQPDFEMSIPNDEKRALLSSRKRSFRKDDEEPLLDGTGAIIFFIYNVAGSTLFTLHMTLAKIGLFWAAVISIGIVMCIWYTLGLLEQVMQRLEDENPDLPRIRDGGEITKHLKLPGLWVVNFLFVFGTVCSLQADALTDLTLVSTNLKIVAGIHPFYTKLFAFLSVVAINLMLKRSQESTQFVFGSFIIYAVLGSLTLT
jgi:hypothetical protein